MRISELARLAGVSTKAVRYYETLGLVDATRLANGYRDYGEHDVQLVREVRALGDLGIRAHQSRPFLDCIIAGNRQGDDCPESVATYRAAIDEIDGRIAELVERRSAVSALLESAVARTAPQCEFAPSGAAAIASEQPIPIIKERR